MDVGLALPQYDYAVPEGEKLPWSGVVSWAERAEARGFASLWLADHLFLGIEKYGGPPGRHFGFDPLVGLAALARRTTRCRLGTLVVCAQLRPPTVLAKALATLDVVSGGRLTVGLGAGWYEPEYEAAGLAFERPGVRLSQLAEAVDIVKEMLGGAPVTHEGRHYRAVAARCLPPPLQRPRPPVWVGGKGDRLLEICARHADGWNTVWSWTREAYAERVYRLHAACDRAGRDPATVQLSLGLTALVGESPSDLARRYEDLKVRTPRGVLDGVTLDQWRRGRLVGTVDEVREQLEGWAASGVATLIVGAGALPFAGASIEEVDLLASACNLEAPCPTSEHPN